MQKNSSIIYTYAVILSLLIAPVVRLIGVLFDVDFLGVVYIAVFTAVLCVMILDTFRQKEYSKALNFKNTFHLDIFSYIAAGGFFFSFVTQCILFFGALMSDIHSMTYLLPIIMSAVSSIITCVYFIIVGFSFGEKNYDFTEFRFIHAMPILWAVSCVFNMLGLSSGFEKDIDSFLKYLMIILLACFFYFFASEVESEKGAKIMTVLLARAYSYVSVLYFFDRLILVLANEATFFCAENALALTGVMICGFTFFFEKHILSRNAESEL